MTWSEGLLAMKIQRKYVLSHDANTEECMLAWEMVDEIDDAATRAGVRYQ